LPVFLNIRKYPTVIRTANIEKRIPMVARFITR